MNINIGLPANSPLRPKDENGNFIPQKKDKGNKGDGKGKGKLSALCRATYKVPEAIADWTIDQWLRAIDPYGQMFEYKEAIDDHFDNLSQIVSAYTTIEDGVFRLDPQFFEDISLNVRCHQQKFEDWFHKEFDPARKVTGTG